MKQPTAFRATFSDMKLVKTRQVAQLIFEVPLEDFDPAYEVLGGVPIPGKERWFGIAALQVPQTGKEAMSNFALQAGQHNAKPQPDLPRQAGAKRDWRDMQPAQQAGIRCEEPAFVAFLKEQHGEDWREVGSAADFVRSYCNVTSRSDLGTNQKARVLWHQLDEQYQAWKALEHA